MCPKKNAIFATGLLLIFALALAACNQEPEEVEVTRLVEVTSEPVTETVEVTRLVEVAPADQPPETSEIPAAVADLDILEQWQNSPHADASAEAFVHWNEDDPAEVPASCAKCHSTSGFEDYLGADGSEFGSVEAAAPVGEVVECRACHNEAAQTLAEVTFPSGATITGLADEARCMQCHQGRASTVQVNNAIEETGSADDPDAVNEELGFINIHYYAAAATKYGTLAMGGYEYEGNSYDALFNHVEPYSTCIDCHNPHTLEVAIEGCTDCHAGLESTEDLPQIRTLASAVDYDGDGNMREGIRGEIETLQRMLYEVIRAYSNEVLETPLVYNAARHPYFFIDANADGEVDDGDSEPFASWSPRLLRAAYNYQVSLKDPGSYAHGGKYTIQLLYDSIEDINQSLSEPLDLSNAHRIDHGHFAGSEEAFRHWDEDGFVPASCSKCHSADGLPFLLAEGVTVSQDLSNGLECTTCHSSLETFERYPVEEVQFPSGAVLSTGDPDGNLCLNCHQGRESTVSVDRLIGDIGDDETAEGLRFLNGHYFAAGATLFGGQAQGAYQFEGQEYAGRNEHVPAFDTCIECHDSHALEVEVEACSSCHEGVETVEDLTAIRFDVEGEGLDYDGDGDVAEGIAMEIATLRETLYAAMQVYAIDTVETSIVYDDSSYPYYFSDADGDGESDGEAFSSWTPRLLRAAYNFQYSAKDPGAYAHNNEYIIQVLYDSLNHLGADVSGLVRPPATAE